MKYLYLIPARRGSKGIPGKNIKPLGGIPLIGHTIRTALQIADAEDVVVSTDSEDIARVSKEFGASVPFIRPEALATDTAGSRDVILHALEYMNSRGGNYDTVVLLQPTSPFRTAEDIEECIKAFEDSRNQNGEQRGAGMAVTVTEARTNPYYSAFETDQEGFLHISKGEGNYTRRQDAPKVWEFNGAVYVIDAEALKRDEISRIKRTIPVPMSADRSIDLDTPADWTRAEQKFLPPNQD